MHMQKQIQILNIRNSGLNCRFQVNTVIIKKNVKFRHFLIFLGRVSL